MKSISPKADWLKRSLPTGYQYEEMRRLIKNSRLHTVCQEAHCPNQWECFSRYTATFLILGKYCTRNCSFCAVEHNLPAKPDKEEAERIASAVADLGLTHVVVTSVTRDDLEDGGASFFAATIKAIHRQNPGVTIEVLIPDFQGDNTALETVINARPSVINHNLETVPRLYPEVRPQASYKRSLKMISTVSQTAPGIITKSGIMLGLGEHDEEVKQTLDDLLAVGCDLLTMGQYLQPSPRHFPLQKYITPDEFKKWQRMAITCGFKRAVCGPFVRSSYKTSELI